MALAERSRTFDLRTSNTDLYHDQLVPIPWMNLIWWVIVSIATTWAVEMRAENELYLKFYAPYTILMIMACVCLYGGFKLNELYMIIPWFIGTGYILCAIHIANIITIFAPLHSADNVKVWSVVTWIIHFVAISYHLMITVQIIQSAVQHCYMKQITNDLHANKIDGSTLQ